MRIIDKGTAGTVDGYSFDLIEKDEGRENKHEWTKKKHEELKRNMNEWLIIEERKFQSMRIIDLKELQEPLMDIHLI